MASGIPAFTGSRRSNEVLYESGGSAVGWSKIGYNAAIGATEEDMWVVGGVYAFPSAKLTATIVSDSAEDDPVKADEGVGTGAHTVTVYYLTDAFVEKVVTVTMNGTAAVTIGADVYRIQNAQIATAGTGLSATGNLSIKSGETTYGYISAGRTRMRQCIWTVPVGKVLYISSISFSCAEQTAIKYTRFTTKANYDTLSSTVLQRGLYMPYHEILLNNTSFTKDLDPPTKLPATTDLRVMAMADASAFGTCSLRGWLEVS